MLHVVGNVAIDSIFQVDRFPLPGESIVARGVTEAICGKGANQAIVAARAGAPVRLAAAIGDDASATRIRAALVAEGMAIDGLTVVAGPSDRSSIAVDASGENTIITTTSAAEAFDPIAAGALDRIAERDTLLCQGNLRPDVIAACLVAARGRGAVTVLNPSPVFGLAGFDWRLAGLAVMNRVEAHEITGETEPRAAAEQLRAAGAAIVVVTLGREGALLVGEETLAIAAPQVEALDTAGAGDVFCGTLVAMRLRGLGWPAALALAVDAAALAVTRRGIYEAFPSRDEIAAMIAARDGRQ